MGDLSLSISEVHSICTEMLCDITSMCEKEGISYYMIYGSLLGTIRHNGPIPWDPDVDIYVPENEIPTFVDAVKRNYMDRYWVDYRDSEPKKPFPRIGLKGYDTEVLHIDVFRMSGFPESLLKRKIAENLGRLLWILWKAKNINPRKYYRKKKMVIAAYVFKGLAFPVKSKTIISWIDSLCKRYELFSTDFAGRVMGRGAIYKAEYFKEYIMKPYAGFMVRVPKGYDNLLKDMYGDYMKFPPYEKRVDAMNKKYIIKGIEDS